MFFLLFQRCEFSPALLVRFSVTAPRSRCSVLKMGESCGIAFSALRITMAAVANQFRCQPCPRVQGGGPSFGNLDDSPPSSLGEGVDVLKLQVAINCRDRSSNSILGKRPNAPPLLRWFDWGTGIYQS